MGLTLATISSYSILVPTVVASVYFTKLKSTYKPFLFFIIAGFIAELWSGIYISIHRPYNVIINVYFLLQAVYVTWQFKSWDLFKKHIQIYWMMQVSYFIIWFFEDLYLDSAKSILSYSIIFSNYAMAIMSITIINKLVVKVHGSLWKNPVFLICLGWLTLFTFQVISESFFKYSLKVPDFAARMYKIVQVTNIFTNIIFGIAILWIPSKPRFILPSSSPA